MKTKTEKILIAMRIIAWLGVIGYAVNMGSQLISFWVSFTNPVAAENIPGVPQNLSALLQYDQRLYVYAMSFVIILSGMFVHLWYQVTTLLSKLNIKSPFTFEVSKKLEHIAHCLLGIWIVSLAGNAYINWLSKSINEQLNIITTGNEYLFTAGIVYIVSQIFKHGIELQEENQQTI